MLEERHTSDEDVTVTEITDVNELEFAVPGAQFGFSRIDRGTDVTRIRSRFYGGASSHQYDVGFSVLGDGAVDHATLELEVLTAAGPTPSIWEGAEATVGNARVYGPGSTRHGVDAAGCRLEVLSIDFEALRKTAEELGVDIGDWENRKAWLDGPRWRGRSILAAGSELDPDGDAGALLSSVALALSSASFEVVSRRTLSSSEIVGRSFEHLDAIGSWFPPIVDLCRAVSTSERRLRQAFIDCFDRPPTEVLRLRALTAVRHALREDTPCDASVSSVAAHHGFRHLGDFGRYYRAAFGETPSQTLSATASTNHNGSG